MKFVLDSSVVAKLFVNEIRSDLAFELLEKSNNLNIELLTSEIILSEVGNVLLKNIKGKRRKGRSLFEKLFQLNFDYIPLHQDFLIDVLDTAQRYHISYFDAIHVNIAESKKIHLITEDKKLLRSFKGSINITKALDKLEKVNK